YLITIDGNFNGISTSGVTQLNKNKYVGIIAGSNYPDTIANNSFEDCTNLIRVTFLNSTSIGNESFKNSTSLLLGYFPEVISTGTDAFFGCESLMYVIKSNNFISYLGNNLFNGNLIPETTENNDIGSSTKKFKDLYLEGVAYINNLSLSGIFVPETTNSIDLGSSTLAWKDLHLDGNVVFDNSTWQYIQLTSSDDITSYDFEYRKMVNGGYQFRGRFKFDTGSISSQISVSNTTINFDSFNPQTFRALKNTSSSVDNQIPGYLLRNTGGDGCTIVFQTPSTLSSDYYYVSFIVLPLIT
ncbi:MAG TPA: hypothetical protein VK982_04180, partial [Bacteroidales bacterium]|nr:hypothetical protein [Bacteroidales bacterium]